MFFLKTKNSKLKTNTGFTLIETLVAISILLIAIISPLILAKEGMVSARLAKNQLVAFYLAQEAVEYVRNVRDSNLLSGSSWLSYLEDCQSGLCYIDAQDPFFSSAINSCGTECPELKKYYPDVNQESFLYSYESGDPSGFVRNIRIENVNGNAEEVSVEVEILWDRGQRSFSVRESLYNLR
ncbi:hypothetical protein A2811_01755 [Candidatus Campbellbacteria bacterium RIFCSPHIGHO2_01_FULL_34_10]|uniref:Type II secretion system protein GspI C-terminal domain-containing protein n=1 Tax=Candidatus Campbellbacteria bacterium RIFCSPHIGHO2_01_FULL_34_10 TaxID=1797577 RepID=A0A1F5ELE1_9BACT|nr:MAG: hypothetical protein A2811_01755 [Candidatus Campbellbacteria bacterium RIFCSPHIGHO2_01_FULL_34_10]